MFSCLHSLNSKSLGQGNGKMMKSKLCRMGVHTPDESSLPAVIPSTRTHRWTLHSSPICRRKLRNPRRHRTLSQTLKTTQVLQVLPLLRVCSYDLPFRAWGVGHGRGPSPEHNNWSDFILTHLLHKGITESLFLHISVYKYCSNTCTYIIHTYVYIYNTYIYMW